MSRRLAQVQEFIAGALNALPGVFSTVQWGGRAYKLPGPNGNTRKPKLLAHVYVSRNVEFVGVDFKLEKTRAAAMVAKHAWICPHSFRTLAPSGWVCAEVRTKSQAKALIPLLKESYTLHATRGEPMTNAARSRKRKTGANGFSRRLDAVLAAKKAEGWSPADADAFDD